MDGFGRDGVKKGFSGVSDVATEKRLILFVILMI
jgi:hypothetical protein